MIKWPKSVKFCQNAPFFMPQLKLKVDDLYQFHLFFKEGVVISNLIVFQEAVVISSYLNFNKTWKKCHFPIKAHAKIAFFGYLNVIVCTAKTRSITYWFFCLIWVRRWYTLQRSDLYTSVVIHKWDQHTSLMPSASRRALCLISKTGYNKWTASSEFDTYRLCEQRRFRRAFASAQSRQNLRYSLIQAVNQEEPSDRKPDPRPLWMAGHAQLKFVMTECSKTQIRLTGPKC